MHAIYPGVGFYDHKRHTKIYHRYYQWVPLVLVMAAFRFYAPRLLWKLLEAKRTGTINTYRDLVIPLFGDLVRPPQG